MELGARLRALRKEHGFSLEQLSTKSGVALATLSRIENGKGAGTFRTHQKIAEALGLAITELYRDLKESDQEAILVHPESEEAESFIYDEKTSAVLLTTQISNKNMLPQLLVFQAGGKTSLEQYRRGSERWIFVLEGALEATVGSKTYRIQKGGTLYFKGSVPHQFRNAGDGLTKIVSVTSPAML